MRWFESAGRLAGTRDGLLRITRAEIEKITVKNAGMIKVYVVKMSIGVEGLVCWFEQRMWMSGIGDCLAWHRTSGLYSLVSDNQTLVLRVTTACRSCWCLTSFIGINVVWVRIPKTMVRIASGCDAGWWQGWLRLTGEILPLMDNSDSRLRVFASRVRLSNLHPRPLCIPYASFSVYVGCQVRGWRGLVIFLGFFFVCRVGLSVVVILIMFHTFVFVWLGDCG